MSRIHDVIALTAISKGFLNASSLKINSEIHLVPFDNRCIGGDGSVKEVRAGRRELVGRAWRLRAPDGRSDVGQFNEFRVQQQQHTANNASLLFLQAHNETLNESNQRPLI